MQTGILHQMWAAATVTDRQCLQEARDDVVLADELGYESFWFGEHHFNRQRPFYGRVPVPELLIARLASETAQIRLGTGVKVLPLEPGARFAEKMSLLDLLTDGRALFGLGEGTPGSFFSDDKRVLFRAALSELVCLCVGEQAEANEALTPAPLRDLTKLIWTAVRNWEAIELTARLGLNFATGQLDLAPDQRVWVDMYRQAGGTGEARGYRLVLVAETTAEADRLAARRANSTILPRVEAGTPLPLWIRTSFGGQTSSSVRRRSLPNGCRNIGKLRDSIASICWRTSPGSQRTPSGRPSPSSLQRWRRVWESRCWPPHCPSDKRHNRRPETHPPFCRNRPETCPCLGSVHAGGSVRGPRTFMPGHASDSSLRVCSNASVNVACRRTRQFRGLPMRWPVPWALKLPRSTRVDSRGGRVCPGRDSWVGAFGCRIRNAQARRRHQRHRCLAAIAPRLRRHQP